MFKPFWKKLIRDEWVMGLILILLFGITRFVVVLNANATGNYQYVANIFLVMWITPLLLLTSEGRKRIGIQKPESYIWILFGFLAGVAMCSLMYYASDFLYGKGLENSFAYISKSYPIPATLSSDDRLVYFLIYAGIGMTFSPIGEEILYRGIIHGSFVEKVGEYKSSLIDSSAFAITHLAHFGIVYNSGLWEFMPIPALLWVLGMFISSRIFFIAKIKSGSLLGAILSHAGFNLAMMYFILYHILR